MNSLRGAFLHYSAPPVIGGVESVLHTHLRLFTQAGYPVAMITGRGEAGALPDGTELRLIPELDSLHPDILACSALLEQGQVSKAFEPLVSRIETALQPALQELDFLVVHNIFTKHFNLPLTAALFRLLDGGKLPGAIAWCHDLSWTSPNSRPRLHAGYPWDLLRTYRQQVTYVAVSQSRQRALAGLLGKPPESIRVIYNGVDPQTLLGLSSQGQELIERLGCWEHDLVILMPVRVTQAKNIEHALRTTAALKAMGVNPLLLVTGPPDPHDAQSMAYYHTLQALRKVLDLEEHARFVYEAGPNLDEPYRASDEIVGELYRVCDLMLMPSHREGFGMPVLEAGLAGVPVASTAVPAATEIGGEEVIAIEADGESTETARRILEGLEQNPTHRLRRRVKAGFTWQALFRRQIEPLVRQAAGAEPAGLPE